MIKPALASIFFVSATLASGMALAQPATTPSIPLPGKPSAPAPVTASAPTAPPAADVKASAAAAAEDKAAHPQQNKMKDCNAEAKSKALKGADRKAFMKGCLSNKQPEAAAAEPANQREKMKACNVQAKTNALKGAERKAFMKECLSK